jgi:hypothetical protein
MMALLATLGQTKPLLVQLIYQCLFQVLDMEHVLLKLGLEIRDYAILFILLLIDLIIEMDLRFF